MYTYDDNTLFTIICLYEHTCVTNANSAIAAIENCIESRKLYVVII